MAKPYQHRIGVRAEICFDLIFDICDPAPSKSPRRLLSALRQTADVDGGFRLEVLTGGTVLWPDRRFRLPLHDHQVG
jgi:hypothetical protein